MYEMKSRGNLKNDEILAHEVFREFHARDASVPLTRLTDDLEGGR